MAGPAELVTCDQTIEHTVRFAKQTLGWTTPRPRHPAQADRWTWLVLAGSAQLRLARQLAGDQRLPWERAPTAIAPVTGAGPPRVSAAAGPARLTGECAETRGMPARPTQGPLLGIGQALPSDQEASEEGSHDHLTVPPTLHARRPWSTASPARLKS
jgi:hypothetical protein